MYLNLGLQGGRRRRREGADGRGLAGAGRCHAASATAYAPRAGREARSCGWQAGVEAGRK